MLKSKIQEFTDKAAKLRVALVGETILDVFARVAYEGYSMKSSCPVYHISNEEAQVQQGGTAAIAGHLRNFVKSLDVFTNTNGEIVKTRYMDSFDGKKYVEVNKYNTSGFKPITIDTSQYDLTIVADFGHGLCDHLSINDGFHLMCQTNSYNFGFNRISKWKSYRKKSICLDLREASLQMNRKIEAVDQDIFDLFNYELNADGLFITLGKGGSVFSDGSSVVRHPAFPSEIVDTIGAGDTYFSFACLLAHLDPNVKDLSIPSLAASLSTTWLCNEKSVNPETLLDYADRFIR